MSNQVNRRNFLKMSVTAGAALALPSTDLLAKESNISAKKLPQRILGKRTGIKVPVLSMGVMNADNPSVVRAAYSSGIVFFDTANGYQNGRNEEMLGEFFADKPRDSFLIATKIREAPAEGAAERFLEKFETSMKRLRMSYVDIFYVHSPTVEGLGYAPIMEVLEKLKKDGRFKYLGLSTHSNEPGVINAAVDNGHYDVILTAYNYNQKHHAELNPAIERASKAGLGIVAMKTMAGGFLDKERTQKVNTRAALKWVLQNKNISTTIPGFTSFDMLEESIDAASNLKFNKEEKDYLSMANNMASLYCQGCDICRGQCTKGLQIAPMMRAYMYNYGYKNPSLAKNTLDELALTGNPCTGCSVCSVQCVSGFQVAQKVRDIARLQAVPQEFLV